MLQLGSNLFLLNQGTPNASVLQLTGSASRGMDTSFGGRPGGGPLWPQYDSLDHVRWGLSDDQPNFMRKVIQRNPIVRPLLESQRDMIFGAGLGFFKRSIDAENKTILTPFTDTKLSEWADDTDLTDYFISAINQRIDNANIFTRWEYSPLDDWFRLSVSDSFATRIGSREGKTAEFHYNPYFGHFKHFQPKESEKIKAFNPRDRDYNIARTVTISHAKENIPGQPHYGFPSWWMAEDAIELANLVMAFHKSGIMNGYNIKYLIRMPQDHFDKEGGRNIEGKAVKEKWQKFSDNLSKWLAGQDNVNKSMLVRYARGTDGKAMDNVDVIPLKNEMSDDAYDKVWSQANQSIANSIGILPTLAGVNPGKGNDSGSQIRVMADFQSEYRTGIHRHLCLKPINQALRLMGYRDVVAAVKGVQLTTLDQDPNGKKPSINSEQ